MPGLNSAYFIYFSPTKDKYHLSCQTWVTEEINLLYNLTGIDLFVQTVLNPRTHPLMNSVIRTARATFHWWSLRTTLVWPFSPCSAASGLWASLPSTFHRRYTHTHASALTQSRTDKIWLGTAKSQRVSSYPVPCVDGLTRGPVS